MKKGYRTGSENDVANLPERIFQLRDYPPGNVTPYEFDVCLTDIGPSDLSAAVSRALGVAYLAPAAVSFIYLFLFYFTMVRLVTRFIN